MRAFLTPIPRGLPCDSVDPLETSLRKHCKVQLAELGASRILHLVFPCSTQPALSVMLRLVQTVQSTLISTPVTRARSRTSCTPLFRRIPSTCPTRFVPSRPYSAAPPAPPMTAQRALLYVPGSNPKQLAKALGGGLGARPAQPDVLILDLEDSVRTEKKVEARRNILELEPVSSLSSRTLGLAVRTHSPQLFAIGLSRHDMAERVRNLSGSTRGTAA